MSLDAGSFHIVTVVNNATMNMEVKITFSDSDFIFFV
jgi:hypothetical protein